MKNNKEPVHPEEDERASKLSEKIRKLKGEDKYGRDREFVKSISLVTSLGFSVVISIVLGVFAGLYLSKKFNAPWIVPVCIIGGLILGVYGAYQLLKPFMKGNDNTKS